jgi:L-fucono-1,5-lactonase
VSPWRIDAHVHVWGPAELETYDWLTEEMVVIRRPFTVDDLRPLLRASGFDGAVLVQTRASLDETRSFVELAAATDVLAGVVGWVDLTSPTVAGTLAALRSGPAGRHLVAVRHQVHDEPDPDWLRREDVRRGLRAVQGSGLAYDLLVRPRELPAAVGVARAFPDLHIVIDHIAKPPIAAGELEPWATLMAQLAELEHVWCKVSGLVTEADWAAWTVDDLEPYVRRVAECFGEDRLLYGSDWPVCTLAGSYERVLEACERALGPLQPDTRAKIFGGNAVACYRLEPLLAAQVANPHARIRDAHNP